MNRIIIASAAFLALTGAGFTQESGPFNQNADASQWTVESVDSVRNIVDQPRYMQSSGEVFVLGDMSTVFKDSGYTPTMTTFSARSTAMGDTAPLVALQGYVGR